MGHIPCSLFSLTSCSLQIPIFPPLLASPLNNCVYSSIVFISWSSCNATISYEWGCQISATWISLSSSCSFNAIQCSEPLSYHNFHILPFHINMFHLFLSKHPYQYSFPSLIYPMLSLSNPCLIALVQLFYLNMHYRIIKCNLSP